ncbi:Stp1/IreP family PP2C-type Ser/Thr phosphatase [Sporosarcina sp. G11-34]|uniref:Stp1/IreP family PP2C-type Ser/Thr phosphatase n=1 Tax=Sporosarcina sp. G11-34 TaxID=2849605 RepID=UPI0022A9EB27|nr:Stp1/IreP family PP2C-type Ser/Thr phosphatase [Sporosarcina sp. G11-34]MCZ2258834.1 Stp1/IreP family PP2C-type Ser/Thr phosphatase [Sporosarcina sp. G11-34]
MLQFEVLSDIGKKRTINEDSAAVYTHPEGIILAIIADGMGGHQGGGFASSTAVKVIGEQFMELDSSEFTTEENWTEWLKEAIFHVNRLLFEYASENDELEGMGTTLEVALVRGRSCLISHVGDSRVYAINQDGVHQITRDHSYVNVLLDSGEITEEEAEVHPQRNWIMKAVGSEKHIYPDLHSIELDDDTFLLICTDGLSNKVDSESMLNIMLSETGLREKVETLVELANSQGGEDNISVIALKPFDMEVNAP